jgi:hypothetical protein
MKEIIADGYQTMDRHRTHITIDKNVRGENKRI